MKLRPCIIATFLVTLFTISARADISFYMKTDELKLECHSSGLTAKIEKLKDYSYSKATEVSVNITPAGMCEIIKKHLQSISSFEVNVKSTLQNEEDIVKVNYCDSSMETCSAIYQKSVLEKIEVKIEELIFYNKKTVPGSQRSHVVEWDSRSCPPIDPACDL